MSYIIGILILIIIILGCLYSRKIFIDRSELIKYEQDIKHAEELYNALNENCKH